MLTLVVCLAVLLATPIYSENVELTSNKERRFTCPGDLVIFTCRVIGSSSLEWRSPLLNRPIIFQASTMPPVTVNRPSFNASLIERNGDNLIANLTSTLQVIASRTFMRNATTVMCLSGTREMEADNFTVAERPADPNVTVNVERVSGGGNTTIRVSWMQPENLDQFDIAYYIIMVNSISGVQNMTTAGSGATSTVITVSENPNNVRMNTTFTATIAAVNLCGETGPAGTVSYTIINCGEPTSPMDGSVEEYHNTTEGAEIFFRCNSMFVPSTRMTATCASNGMWTPDPAGLICTYNCGQPVAPQRGSLESHTSTIEGSAVFYSCRQHLVPARRMRANCTRNGWSPDPAALSCDTVNCVRPNGPRNGSIENTESINIGGTEIVFRCNTGFVPAGNRMATCVSPDGISVVGTWTPDPADLVCNASDVDCGVPSTSAGGLTVEPYNSTAVSSFIFYQCQSGFNPSNSSSVCGEDGMWSPDPSQVMCLEEPTTMSSVSTPPRAAGLGVGAIVGIVVVVLVVVILLVAVIIIMGVVWRRRRSDVSSKPPPQSDDVAMYSVVPDSPKKPPPYKGYMNQGPGTEVEYTTIPDIAGKSKGPSNGVEYKNVTSSPAHSKNAEAQYDLPPGSDHPQGLVYAQVDVKPKKPTARPRDQKPPNKVEPGVEYASIAYQPEDAAEKSQQAADTTPKPKKKMKKHVNADELLNLDVLLIQLRSVNAKWYDLGLALDVPDSILDDIKDQCKADPEQCMVEMVDSWITRQMHVGKPTWTDLAAGLRKINQIWLADALENIYNTGVLPITVNMTEIPESLFPDDGGAPPPIPVRGTLTEDAETPPPKPPKSWGSPPATKSEPSPPWPHRAQ